jgi:uncharacterized protein DUF4349
LLIAREMRARNRPPTVEGLMYTDEQLVVQFRRGCREAFTERFAPESLNAAIASAAARLDSKAPGAAEKPGPHRVRESSIESPKKYVGAMVAALAVILSVVISKPNLLRAPNAAPIAQPNAVASSDLSPYLPLPQRGQNAALPENREAHRDRYVPSASEGAESRAHSQAGLNAPQVSAPVIEQTVSLHIVPTNYDQACAAVEKLAAARGGYVGSLAATAQSGAAREVSVELRIPARQADAFVADLRKLGKVVEQTRSSEEVTAAYVDLQARTKAAKAAEQRLMEMLATRTGKLSDVLEAERELARVRSEIESMQGQSNVMLDQVNDATVKVELSEEYREKLQSHSTSPWTKIRNAAIDGTNNLEEAILGVLVFILDYGFAVLFWLGVMLVPSWLIWRRIKSHPEK